MITLRQFVEQCDERARVLFADTGELHGMYHIVGGDGKEAVPGRAEVVTYFAEDQHEGFLTASRVITRDKKGRPALGPLEF